MDTTEPAAEFADPDATAVVLFTSGTTSAPKAVELTHNNLTSYIMGTVDFDSAAPGDAALICVAPYHIAGSRIVFPHTEVVPALRGRGFAPRLVGDALADVRGSGRTVVPRCWYVREFIQSHPEFSDLLAA